MWLIADSGSTKTEWVLFDSIEKKKLLSSGLNPLFLSGSDFKARLRESIPEDWVKEVTKLWFYGAGCGTKIVKESTTRWLASIFTKAEIQVESDLIAAARATYGTDKGIVAILGTGSNSCYYDGQRIVNQVKPLGFILGDEGSGTALGKALLTKLLRNQFSPKLLKAIYDDMGMNYDEIIKRVYKSDWPNRFIASCSRILYTHKKEIEIDAIIRREFDRFGKILTSYGIVSKVNVVGSVGYFFKLQLEEVLKENGLEVGIVIASPADGLVNYHLKNDL